MKTKSLLLIRHAKAEQEFHKRDFDRNLAPRGETDSKIIGKFILSKNLLPQHIFVSAAKRTKQTANIIRETSHWMDVPLTEHEELYLASCLELMFFISKLPSALHHIVLVGHNEGITELFNRLSPNRIDNLPTCALGLFGFETNNWASCFKNDGELLFYSSPKILK